MGLMIVANNTCIKGIFSYKCVVMSPAGVAATELLERAGIGIDRFAAMVGVKPSSVRSCFSNGRLSKKMLETLHDVSNDETVKQLAEVASPKPVDVPPDAPRMGRVYLIPVNKRLRMVEFSDGRHPNHGKFLSKPDRFPVGSAVRLKLVEGDIWEPVGDYDRRGRLIE